MGMLTHFPANATTLPPPKSQEQRIYDAVFAATSRAVMGYPVEDVAEAINAIPKRE